MIWFSIDHCISGLIPLCGINFAFIFSPCVMLEIRRISVQLPTPIISVSIDFAVLTKQITIMFLVPNVFIVLVLEVIKFPLFNSTSHKRFLWVVWGNFAYLLMYLFLHENSINFTSRGKIFHHQKIVARLMIFSIQFHKKLNNPSWLLTFLNILWQIELQPVQEHTTRGSRASISSQRPFILVKKSSMDISGPCTSLLSTSWTVNNWAEDDCPNLCSSSS